MTRRLRRSRATQHSHAHHHPARATSPPSPTSPLSAPADAVAWGMRTQSDHIDAITLAQAHPPYADGEPASRGIFPPSPPRGEGRGAEPPSPSPSPPIAHCLLPIASQHALLRDYLEGCPDLISLAELHDLELEGFAWDQDEQGT